VELLRERSGRSADDRNLIMFETALAEIGANSLVHGQEPGAPDSKVEFQLRLDGGTAIASFTDRGPPVHNHLTRAMPATTSEAGRGIAIARKVLDRLAYTREGEVNTWRLVKRL
jgi:serine/threonine-protein kinase RsbW